MVHTGEYSEPPSRYRWVRWVTPEWPLGSYHVVLRAEMPGVATSIDTAPKLLGLANTNTIPSVPEDVIRTELSFLLIAFEKER